MAPQPPAAVGCLGEQHPRPFGQGRIAGGVSDDGGEPPDDLDLLVAVECARVGQYLDADVVGVAVDVRQARVVQVVHECCRVVAEHRDVRHTLDAHDRAGQVDGESMSVCERVGTGVDVDHRHGVSAYPTDSAARSIRSATSDGCDTIDT